MNKKISHPNTIGGRNNPELHVCTDNTQKDYIIAVSNISKELCQNSDFQQTNLGDGTHTGN